MTVSIESLGTREERDELVRLRRDFHEHPELGYEEVRTSGIVTERLQGLGFAVRTGVAKTGVLGDHGQGTRGLYVRADMDALPILEENEVPYCSRNQGVMHACGHDAHTAVNLLTSSRFAGSDPGARLRFAFQPAEEGGQGADRMMEQGALDGMDAALGLHVWNSIPVGKVAITEGPAMASVDDFTIRVHGVGCHAAEPHQGDDPIVKAAGIIRDLQTIVSRRISPYDRAVVSVTQIEGGSAFNVIPNEVVLRGTVRTFDADVQRTIHDRIREIVAGKGDFDVKSVTQVLVNDPAMCRLVRKAAEAVVGPENIIENEVTMGGEDFASVLAAVPGCFFFVGSAGDGGGFPHHNARFDIDERALAIGLEVMTGSIRNWIAEGAG
ncbi:MAG: peptidase M20 [Gemmatimonadota bacterium]|nr:MAG: peptidase M20 [Gemmatimonadota bacterium]